MKAKKRKEVLHLIGLSLCTTASQLALILISMSDTVMMGRVSRNGLAAGTLISSFYNLGILFCMGMIIPIAIQLGMNKQEASEEKRILITAAYYKISIGMAFLAMIFLVVMTKINVHIGRDSQMLSLAEDYAMWLLPGILPWVLFYLIRNILLCYQKVRFTALLSIISVFLNIILNWLFINGIGSVEGFGAKGCAIATSVTNWVIFLIAFGVLRHNKKIIPDLKYILMKNKQYLKKTFQFGFPTGMVFFSEYLIFSFGNSLLSSISTTAVVAFGIAVSWLNLCYMFPVALSQVITEPLAGFFATNKMGRFRNLSRTSLVIVLLYNAVGILAILAFKREMIHFIVGANITVELYNLAENFMYLIAVVIFLYNFIVVFSGIMRGFGDVKTPLVMMFIMYWGVGIGGTVLFTKITGAYGVLIGMCFGFLLTFAGICGSYLKKIRRK